jgi:hypothetical protein
MSKEAITPELLEVQNQGALPRALEKPPASERGVMRSTDIFVREIP